MSIFLQSQRPFIPVEASGREKMEYPLPSFPCYIDLSNIEKYPGRGVPWHWHEDVELFMVLAGRVVFDFASHTQTVNAGEGGFVNHNVLHGVRLLPGEAARTMAVQFSPGLLTGGVGTPLYRRTALPVLSHPNLEQLRFSPDVPWQADVLDCLRAVAGVGAELGSGRELLIAASLSRAWYRILNAALAVAPARESSSAQSEGRLKHMMRFIHAHYQQPLTLSEIAGAANISPRECTRCFTQLIHCSPVAYLIEYRIATAAALLENTAYSVSEICLRVGFGNPSYFTRMFARQMGMTPKKYQLLRAAGIVSMV